VETVHLQVPQNIEALYFRKRAFGKVGVGRQINYDNRNREKHCVEELKQDLGID
jgi:hypothetical protein